MAWALIAAAGAQATVVTVGSPLTGSFFPGSGGGAAVTYAITALPEPGANVTSPVSGTIVRWRLLDATGGPFSLRVLTPAGPNTYKGAGTSAPQTPISTSTQTYSTNLQISAGDLIGLDAAENAGIGIATVNGAAYAAVAPPVADGSPATFTGGDPNTELAFNADIATPPSNADTLGGVKLNKNAGTATLAVNVPGPGTLTLTGNNVKPQRPTREATASKAVTTAGTVKLLVKAKGKAKKKLNKSGKVKVKVVVTYTPTGSDLPGTSNSQTKSVKLIKKH